MPRDAHVHLSQNVSERHPESLSHPLAIQNPILWLKTSVLTSRLSGCPTCTTPQPDSHAENYFVCIRRSVSSSRMPLQVSKSLLFNVPPSHTRFTIQLPPHVYMSFKHRWEQHHVGHNLSYQSFGKTVPGTNCYFPGLIRNVKAAKLGGHPQGDLGGRKHLAGQFEDTWKSPVRF